LRKESGKDALVAMRKSGTLSASKIGVQRTEEYGPGLTFCGVEADCQYLTSDEIQLSKLHQMGLKVEDELKLLALRDYMLKLGNGILR
jgi:hypothetical protein